MNEKKKYKAIFFDLDGTLLPMNMDEFTYGYFSFLAKKLIPYGVNKETLVPAIWTGTKAMMKNDGKKTNDRVFWETFENVTSIKESLVGDACLDFYSNEFKNAKVFTKDNPLAKKAVEIAHEKAPFVALTTNPIFPLPGQLTRIDWLGLKKEDFDLITSYESDSYCKPNPKYFLSVCDRLGLNPNECLIIGNDEYEDMWCGNEAGLDCYLVTDTMIENKDHPWNGPKGTFEEMIEMLKGL